MPQRNGLTVLRVVNKRADLLEVGNLLDTASLDPYSFVRDAYLQKRRADIQKAAEDAWPKATDATNGTDNKAQDKEGAAQGGQ